MFIEFVQRYAKKIKLLALFLGIGAAVGVAIPAFAQGGAPGDASQIKGIQDALKIIMTGGAMFIASVIVDRVKVLDALDTGLRMGAVSVIAIVLTWLSRAALQFVPAAWFASVDPFFMDALPYIYSVTSIFAAKAVRNGFAKAQTLTRLSVSPYSS